MISQVHFWTRKANSLQKSRDLGIRTIMVLILMLISSLESRNIIQSQKYAEIEIKERFQFANYEKTNRDASIFFNDSSQKDKFYICWIHEAEFYRTNIMISKGASPSDRSMKSKANHSNFSESKQGVVDGFNWCQNNYPNIIKNHGNQLLLCYSSISQEEEYREIFGSKMPMGGDIKTDWSDPERLGDPTTDNNMPLLIKDLFESKTWLFWYDGKKSIRYRFHDDQKSMWDTEIRELYIENSGSIKNPFLLPIREEIIEEEIKNKKREKVTRFIYYLMYLSEGKMKLQVLTRKRESPEFKVLENHFFEFFGNISIDKFFVLADKKSENLFVVFYLDTIMGIHKLQVGVFIMKNDEKLSEKIFDTNIDDRSQTRSWVSACQDSDGYFWVVWDCMINDNNNLQVAKIEIDYDKDGCPNRIDKYPLSYHMNKIDCSPENAQFFVKHRNDIILFVIGTFFCLILYLILKKISTHPEKERDDGYYRVRRFTSPLEVQNTDQGERIAFRKSLSILLVSLLAWVFLFFFVEYLDQYCPIDPKIAVQFEIATMIISMGLTIYAIINAQLKKDVHLICR